MKSGTSSCKWVALRKDLSRFWPVWMGYVLFLILLQMIIGNDDLNYWYGANLGESLSFMGIINGIVALAVAQLLFGDLFNPRMCSGIHSLPLKREQWFSVHVQAGFLCSVIPTALMLLLSEAVISLHSNMEQGWQLPLYWWLGANVQYIFFFGLAVFSVMCSGNRLGSAIVYGMFNFGPLLVYLLVDQLYTPLLRGVVTLAAPFEKLSPMICIADSKLIDAERVETGKTYLDAFGTEMREFTGRFALVPEGWHYIVAIAAVGILLLLAARRMYRQRQLECAGDFLAVRWLEPVFQVVFTLLCGSAFHGIFLLFFGLNADNIYLLFGIGMLVGWFAGQMLLERTTRVFRPRILAGFLMTAGIVALSLYITKLDPLGIADWVPRAENLKSASMSIRYGSDYEAEDPEELKDLIRLHEIALEQNVAVHPDYDSYYTHPGGSDPAAARISLTYVADNGWKAEREYYVLAEGEGGEIIRKYFTRLDMVIEREEVQDADDLRHELKDAGHVSVNGHSIPKEMLTEEFLTNLADAIAADCDSGAMVQLGAFHPDPIIEMEHPFEDVYQLIMDISGDDFWCYLHLYKDCENVLAVLEPTGVLDQVRADHENSYG